MSDTEKINEAADSGLLQSRLVRLGVKLHPWQETIIEAMDSGKQIMIIHARPRKYRCFMCQDTGKTDDALGFNGYGPCPRCSLPNDQSLPPADTTKNQK